MGYLILGCYKSFYLQFKNDDKVALLKKILEIYHSNKLSHVRLKISNILGEFRQLPKFDLQVWIEYQSKYLSLTSNDCWFQLVGSEIIKLLSNETSQKVCASLINALTKLGTMLPCDSPIIVKIINSAVQVIHSIVLLSILIGLPWNSIIYCWQMLSSSNHLVKCHSLFLLGELTNPNNSRGENVKTICKFTKSQDPRVRTSAYNALVSSVIHLKLHELRN